MAVVVRNTATGQWRPDRPGGAAGYDRVRRPAPAAYAGETPQVASGSRRQDRGGVAPGAPDACPAPEPGPAGVSRAAWPAQRWVKGSGVAAAGPSRRTPAS